MRVKQVIIDKDVFRGENTAELCAFAGSHFLILPDVLYYECVTANEKREELLDRFREVILAGGCICASRNTIIQKEAKDLSPYGPLVDMQEIRAVRQTFKENSRPYNSKAVKAVYKNELGMAQMIMDLADGFTEKLASEQPGLLTEIRKCDNSKAGRFERLVQRAQFVDSQDIHSASKRLLKGITEFPEEYCLSDDWVSWHFLRLILIQSMERTFLRQKGDASGIIPIEHDLQDITYVMLLSRADGLLTRDNKLVKPLAKAAFSEKHVFSDLNEVPQKWAGYWS